MSVPKTPFPIYVGNRILERFNSLTRFQTPESEVSSQGGGGTHKIAATCLSEAVWSRLSVFRVVKLIHAVFTITLPHWFKKEPTVWLLNANYLPIFSNSVKPTRFFVVCVFFKHISHVLRGQDLVLPIMLAYKGEGCNHRPLAFYGSLAKMRQHENSMNKQPNVLENLSTSYHDSEL